MISKVGKQLKARHRKQISESNFAIPEKRKYPIHDKTHARNALAMVAKHGSPDEKQRVRSAVSKKFPGIGG